MGKKQNKKKTNWIPIIGAIVSIIAYTVNFIIDKDISLSFILGIVFGACLMEYGNG